MSGPILEVNSLVAFYGPIQALFGLDFEVEEGGVTALLGANGAGKTTTLRALSGLIRRAGYTHLCGRPIGGLSTEAVARLGVAHVPDGRGTFTSLTVEENCASGPMSAPISTASRRISSGCSAISPHSKDTAGSRRAHSGAGSNRC